jgi:hypothetical protein
MSQRNWKTSQRRARNPQPTFASRPIGTTLTSIKESSNSVSTTGHSIQSSTASSSSIDKMATKQSQEEQKVQNDDVNSSASSSNNIFQIIEEECYNGQLQQQKDQNENDTNNSGYLSDKSPPPKEAFQHSANTDDDQIDYVATHFDDDIEEKGADSYEIEEDDGAPIIYANHDDDSVSQITSSIAGNSTYSSEYMLSRLSFPNTNNNQRYQPQAQKLNHGGVSRWSGNNISSPAPGSVNTDGSDRNSNGNEKNTSLLDDEELNKFFGPSDTENNNDMEPDEIEKNQTVDQGNETHSAQSQHQVEISLNNDIDEEDEAIDGLIDVNIYTNKHTNSYSLQDQYHHDNDDDQDDLTLRDMYSIGPSLSNDSRRTFNSSTRNGTIGSFLQQARLKTKSSFVKVKHTIKRYLRSDSSNMQQKKDDDHDQNSTNGETDYFGLLMSSSFVSTSPNSAAPHQRKKRENQINALWVSFLLVMIWVLLFLAKIGNDSAWEKNRNKRMPLGKLRGAEQNVETIIGGVTSNGAIDNNVQPPHDAPMQPIDKSSFPIDHSSLAIDQQPLKNDPIEHPLQPIDQSLLLNDQNKGPNDQIKGPNDQNVVPNVQSIQTHDDNVIRTGSFDVVDRSHIGMPIPNIYDNFLDINVNAEHFLPFFWHVPRAAGATVNEILGVCYHLRMASNAGSTQGHGNDESLQLLDVGAGHTYVNVDVSNPSGIKRAASLGLVSSGLSDIVVSALVNEVGQLFDQSNPGKIFTLLRNPVDRATSLFYFMQDVVWRAPESFNQDLANISIEDFYKRRMGESNWQVRYLTDQTTKAFIDEVDLKRAKEILRRKFLVGLTSEKEKSFERFEKFFGWQLTNDIDRECVLKRMGWDWSMRHPHQVIQEGTETWNLIAAQNQYDMQLYEYAEALFAQQSVLIN